jgi:hypothetical protein
MSTVIAHSIRNLVCPVGRSLTDGICVSLEFELIASEID